MKSALPVVALVAVLTGCAAPADETQGDQALLSFEAAALGTYSDEEVIAEADRLIAMMNAQSVRDATITRLSQVLSNEKFRGGAGDITGVLVYEGKQGGFMFSGGGGEGLISFKDGLNAAQFSFYVAGVGASVGGSSHFGVALVCDLGDQANFDGVYEGQSRNATLGEKSKTYSQLQKPEPGPKPIGIYAFGAAVGAGAGISKTKVTVQCGWHPR
jgi:hypothetical protein